MSSLPLRRAGAVLPGAAALVGAAALGVTLLYLLAVRTEEGQRIDDAARGNLSADTAPRVYEATSDLLDTISLSSLALLGAGIMAIALLRGRPRLAAGAGVLVLGANLTTQVLKEALPRPELVGNSFENDAGSLPSGHVTVAMSLALALLLVTPPALRWLAALAGGAYAAGVGVAVMALDWHRPSDVIAAYLVATAWAAAVVAALAVAGRGRGMGEPERRPGRRARLAGAAAAALGLGFLVVVAVTAARRVDLLRVVDDRTHFAAASAVCAAACAALMVSTASLVGRTQGRARRRAAR